MRKSRVIVPSNAVACPTAKRCAAVLAHFRAAIDIPTPPGRRLRWR